MMYNEKTAARLMNAVIRDGAKRNENLGHAWIDESGRMCATDGFRAYRLNKPIAGVLDAETDSGINSGIVKIWPSMKRVKPLALPTLAEVRAMLEEDRQAEKRGETISHSYYFGTSASGEQLPAVNLRYLADVLQLFPGACAYYSTPVRPILFQSEDGSAIICPVKVTGGVEKAKHRRVPPAPVKRDKSPAFGLRAFAAVYA